MEVSVKFFPNKAIQLRLCHIWKKLHTKNQLIYLYTFNLGEVLLQLGRKDEAIDIFRQVLEQIRTQLWHGSI